MKETFKDSIFQQEIEQLKRDARNEIEFHSNALNLSNKHLTKLKMALLANDFQSMSDEIEFFKIIKARVLSEFIYHSRLKAFFLQIPKASKKEKGKFIRANIRRLNRFFQSNKDFLLYIEKGDKHLDEFYFTRKHAQEFQVPNGLSYYRDPDFSTSHDLLLATLNANRRLIEFFENKLLALSKPNFQEIPKSQLKWTSSKAAFTELTYALYHGGAINHGNTDIRQIANALEQTFNLAIGDVYRTFSAIRSRKNGRAKFLNELSISLISGMDTLDE